jgi:DNA modification methylase
MHTRQDNPISFAQAYKLLAEAARDRTRVNGWTHNFYRYPARFSPKFAAGAIESFSKPGDLILDPYMGGGTAVVEGLVLGRSVVGNDLNSLAAFIAKAKVTPLSDDDVAAVKKWAKREVPNLGYFLAPGEVNTYIDAQKTKNLTLTKARFIKKVLAGGLATVDELNSVRARNFARCAMLRVGQWALDGRERHTPLTEFRERLSETTAEMLVAIKNYSAERKKARGRAYILHGDAENIGKAKVFADKKAALVVTSPPYPGVHVLYHRWQVDGRHETPAPYWIAGCNDGEGGSFYNFADRRETAAAKYFQRSLKTLKAIRTVVRDGGYMVQMIAFNRPTEQLPRYLKNMEESGFAEVSLKGAERIWRQVPSRKWHARQMGKTNSSNEVVLIHRAV